MTARRSTSAPAPEADTSARAAGRARDRRRFLRGNAGGLALLWNHARRNEDDLPWRERLQALVSPYLMAARSFSLIADLAEPERASVMSEVRELAAPHASLTLRYRTEIYWTRLI